MNAGGKCNLLEIVSDDDELLYKQVLASKIHYHIVSSLVCLQFCTGGENILVPYIGLTKLTNSAMFCV